MSSDRESDEFEIIDFCDVAKALVADDPPDIAKITAWLKPTKYDALSGEFKRHLSARSPGTGEWIRDTMQFNQWISSENHSSIWIKAVPGAGKSVVAASMIDSLARNEDASVLFFFFRQIIESNRTAISLLRDWIAQLLESSKVLQVALWDLAKQDVDLESLSQAQLWRYLKSGLRTVDRAYLIVDALDEMDIDEEFLAKLNSLGLFRPAHVKILMTSRPKQYLQRSLKDPQVIHFALEEELVKRDIAHFVRQRAASLSSHGVSKVTQQLIHDTVLQRSQGLFLYARLMFDQIEDSVNGRVQDQAAIEEMITRLPVGLEDMYNRILFDHASLAGVEQKIQLLILSLVTHSARPLRLIEIAHALGPDLCGDRNPKEIVRGACGPLLEIMEDEVVQILHHSFTEFLLETSRNQHSAESSSQFPVLDPVACHIEIASICLHYLQFRSLNINEEEEENQDDSDSDDYFRFYYNNWVPRELRHIDPLHFPFLEYSSNHWPYHAENCKTDNERLFDALNKFCAPGSLHFKTWTFLNFEIDILTRGRPANPGTMPLHVAAKFNLLSWTGTLLHSGINVDVLDDAQCSPIFWAAMSGHTEMVELLLKAGAKPDLDRYDGLKPLHLSAMRNHFKVVKLLLLAGVSPTTPKTRDYNSRNSSEGEHPLQYACENGHLESVLEMLPYLGQEELDDALCWVAEKGHAPLVSVLLEKSTASPSAIESIRYKLMGQISGGSSALTLAVKSMKPASVRMLLDKGADVHSTKQSDKRYEGFRRGDGGIGETALHALAKARITSTTVGSEILGLLLKAGANLEARDAKNNTPILLVSGLDPESNIVLKLLMAAGADVSAENAAGDTLLLRACQLSPSTKLAEMLLGYGADPKKPRLWDGATPIHSALGNYAQAEEHLKLLISYGADINAPDSEGNTALHALAKSSYSSQTEKIDVCLRLGANPNIQNARGETCLHIFSSSNDRNGINSIIDAGASFDIYDHNGRTPLLTAVEKCTGLCEVFLDHAIKPSISKTTLRTGKSALHLACKVSEPQKAVQLLLKHGADPLRIDANGNTLLHELATVYSGTLEHIGLLGKLVKSGVSVHSKNFRGQTAAHILRRPEAGAHWHNEICTQRQTFIKQLLSLDHGFNVNEKDVDGYTALHYAASYSEVQAFSLILAGATLNLKAHNFRTPLHCAARGRQSTILAMILNFATQRGMAIDIDAVDVDGRTPLHDACRSGMPESVRILIDAGADINKNTKSKRTPLMVCSEFVLEKARWSGLQAESNCTTNGNIQDDFRHPHANSNIEDTARIGIIAKMLIEAGTNNAGALDLALSAHCAELVVAIRAAEASRPSMESTKSSEENDGDSYYQYDKRDGYNIPGGFWDTFLTLPSTKLAEVFETYKGNGPRENLIDFIPHLDEAAINLITVQGGDCINGRDHAGRETFTLGKIASLGLTEYMYKVVDKAKALDDPSYLQSLRRRYENTFEDQNYPKVRPVLQDACQRPFWNMDIVRLLVEQGGVNINAHQQILQEAHDGSQNVVSGATALHVLAEGNSWWNFEAIEYLLQNGANTEALDENGKTPLEIASGGYGLRPYGDKRGFFRLLCCEALLRGGANSNRENSSGLTPLNFVCQDLELAQLLLKNGANVNAGTKGALMSAVESNSIVIAQLYLEHEADCNKPDVCADKKHNRYAVHSVHYPYWDLKRYPLLAAAFPQRASSTQDWRERLVGSPTLELVMLLLQAGARVDLPLSESDTLLHYIFEHAQSPAIRSFLEHSELDMNMRDQNGRSVFLAACDSKVLSDSDDTYTPKDEREKRQTQYIPSYLLLANSEKYSDRIDYLATDHKGNNMLMHLLPRWDSKSDPVFSMPEMPKLVLQKNNAGFSPLHLALKERRVSVCLEFIDRFSADILEADPNGDTTAHHMCGFPEGVPLIKKFLKAGGDVNARNNHGSTSFLTMISIGKDLARSGLEYIQHLDLFVANSADVRAVDNDGVTALHHVARGGYKHEQVELFQELVKLGCDPLQEDKSGMTALDLAAAHGNQEILELYQRKKD